MESHWHVKSGWDQGESDMTQGEGTEKRGRRTQPFRGIGPGGSKGTGACPEKVVTAHVVIGS